MAKADVSQRLRFDDQAESSLASLSRTLDTLEARFARLPARAPRHAASAATHREDGDAARLDPPAPRTQPERTRGRSGVLADAVSEIVMRRRMLDDMGESGNPALAAAASRVAAGPAPRARTRPAAPADVGRPLARRIEAVASQAEALGTDDANFRLMSEVAAELQRLRAEVKDDTTSGRAAFEGRFDELRSSFDQLRHMIGANGSPQAIGTELQSMSAALASLTEAGADRSVLNDMRSELEELRHVFQDNARESTVREVGDQWKSFESRYAARSDEDLAAKTELKNELERLRESLRSLAREDQMDAAERRWTAFEERYREPPTEKAISEAVRAELDGMRAKLESLADATSFHSMEARYEELERRLESREQDESVRLLAERLGEIEARLGQLPGSVDIASLEGRIHALADNVDALARRSEEADLQNFLSVEERLDEISQAIVASAAQPALDMAPFERIEARIAALGERVDEADGGAKVERLSRRIAELAARVEEIAVNPAATATTERMELLAERFEAAFSEFEPQSVDTSAIEKRIDLIAERFEIAVAELETSRTDAEAWERRLAALSAKLEESAAEPRMDGAMIRSLETQIERMADSLARFGTLHEDFEADVDERLGAIEKRLDEQRDALIQAAREVGEETARRLQSAGDSRQAEHVARLSESLESLEVLSRENDGRSDKVFDAVHSALLKIADRLERIELDLAVEDSEPAARLPERERFETAAAATGASLGGGGIALAERAREAVALSRPRDEVAAPALDASEAIDREEMNRPLEPGSGMPDIASLLERVRAAQRSRAEDTQAAVDEADMRAAARQAAKAASLEAGQLRSKAAEPAGADNAAAEGRGGLRALVARRRKAIMTGVVAVIVALSALPIGKSLVVREEGAAPAVAALTSPAAPVVDVSPEPAAAASSQPDAGAEEASAVASETPAAPVADATAPVAAASEAGEGPKAEASPPAAAEAASAPEASVATAPQPQPQPEAPVMIETAAPPAVTAAAATDPAAELASVRSKLPPTALAMPAVPDDIGTPALRNAALAGDPKAAFEIGLRLMEGRSGEPQPARALDWFAQGALKNYAPAQYSLGTLYEKGNGVARDTETARDWYRLAADNGNVRAMHNLAVLYATGIDGRSQPEAAAEWFVKAAEHGMRDSQYNLGILYARGSGVKQDLVQSYKWFGIVADAGDSDAAAKRDEIAKSMAPDQLTAAKDAIRTFTPAPRTEAANTVDTPPEWQDAKERTTSSIDMTKAIRNIQAILGRLGYDAGTPDGVLGGKTKLAIAAFQKDNGMNASGEVDGPLIRALLQKKDAKPGA